MIFETTQQIIMHIGATTSAHDWQNRLADKTVMLVTDKGLMNAGVVMPVVKHLQSIAKQVIVYDGVNADPLFSQVENAILLAKQAQVEAVIGLGGGSSLDTAKLVALLANSTQSLKEVIGVNQATGQRLPLVQIPTTAGTGSEVTPIAIVTSDTDEKMGIVSPLLLPDCAVLDAALTIGLPATITAMTAIDAMVHAIEAFTSKVKKNPLSDTLAKQALALLYANFEAVLVDGSNVTARENMLLGSLLAGMAFANAPVGAVHALAYPIGGIFHVPHGLSNALVLAPVLRYNLSHAMGEYAELGRLLNPHMLAQADQAAAENFIEQMSMLVASAPITQRLSEVGIGKDDIDRMATDALKIQRLLVNNPREVTLQAAKDLYLSVL